MRLIPVRDPTVASLEQCCEAMTVWGFDPREEESIAHAASWLGRLGNDRQFLGDRLVDLLADRGVGRGPNLAISLHGLQTNRIMLHPPGRGAFAISASIWPSTQEALLRASGPEAFGYGTVHDHSFDFLTLPYFGPGCPTDDWEYDHALVAGYPGEPVQLQPKGSSIRAAGMLAHYRANRDVHCRHAPDSISVSLTLSHHHLSHGWREHYVFEAKAGRISRVLGHGPSEAFLRIAVGLGGDEALDLAHRFGRHHPSDRMRLAAWRALASIAPAGEERDAIWRQAESTGSLKVAEAAARRRGRVF